MDLTDIRFTRQMVEQTLKSSERSGGHAGSRHVSITNQGLMERVPAMMNREGAGIVLITGFLTFADAIDACTLVLNSPEAAAGLRQLYGEKDGYRETFKEIDVRRIFRMRYAMGAEATAVLPTSCMTLVAERNTHRPHGLHVVTFFGTLAVS